MVKVRVGDELIQTAADGNGPVNALDAAVRKALLHVLPAAWPPIKLVDYKVRIIDSAAGDRRRRARAHRVDATASGRWTHGGQRAPTSSRQSWLALADSLEWWLMHRGPDSGSPANPKASKA